MGDTQIIIERRMQVKDLKILKALGKEQSESVFDGLDKIYIICTILSFCL